MALWKYFKQTTGTLSLSNLSVKDIEAAQKSISKALDVAATIKSQQRGKYNSYSPEQRAKIGKLLQKMAQHGQQGILQQSGASI